MANARFLEILRCHGVDETETPYPGMIVPLGGENQVVLETSGMNLDVQKPSLDVYEYDGQELTTRMLKDLQDALSRPDVDLQERDAYLPSIAWQKPRFFRVLGTIKTGFPGTFIRVAPKGMHGRRTSSTGATLQVAVVDRLVIKVAIRNVRARDQRGNMRYHAKRPCDPAKEVALMNAIWTPQTNILFELVPSTDLNVDHDDPTTREGLTKAYGLKIPATFYAESKIWSDKNSGWFAQHKVRGTHMTFFVVHMIHWGGDPEYGKGGYVANGTMNRELGVSFISDIRLPGTIAHEAGHYVGDMDHDGENHKELMWGSGAGFKIPFKTAKRFRESFAKRPVL